MAKVLKTVAVVAAVVALTFAIPGVGPAIGTAVGVSISAGTAATIATVAAAVSAIATTGAQMLQKPPDMKGTVNEVVIGANMAVPYVIGRTFVGGMQVYDDSAPGVNGHPNKDRTQIFVGTHAGPIDSFQQFMFDYSPVGFSGASWTSSRVATGYYGADGGYLWLNARMGTRPDTALTAFPGRSAFTNWPSTAKLSGMASWSITMEFDEDGERYASGIPAPGMVAKWVLAYDPRLDSTYPGGSGTQRLADESTWTWTENPGLHALTYARGRFMGPNDVKVVGPGIPTQFIDIAAFVELANACDANGWTCGGALYEGPGVSRWDNLKQVLAAAAAEPAWVGGMLTVKMSAPRVALATLTADDLADGDIEVQAMSSWKDKFNTIVPRYRSEAHRWEYVQADAVTNPTYLAEDGETKTDEVQFDLCQDVDQAAQLAAYTLVNRREFGPIKLTAKPAWMGFKPGEAIALDLPELGLDNQLAVMTSRTVDPATGSVQMSFVSETTAKHAYALGKTGVAPPTPSIVPPEDVDAAVSDLTQSLDAIQAALRTTYPRSMTMDAIDAGATATIRMYGATTSSPFILDYPGADDPTVGPVSIAGLAHSATYYPYCDVTGPGDAAPVFGATTVYSDALNSAAHPYRIYFGRAVITPAVGGGTNTGGGIGGGYGGGGGFTGPGGGSTNYA